MTNELHDRRPLINAHVLIGSAMIVVGVAFLLGLVRGWEIEFWSSWWTVLLFGLGFIRFVDPGFERGIRRSRRAGLWLMMIGAWGFISQNELFGLDFGTSWPLLVIGVGIITVWKAIEGRNSGRFCGVERTH